MEHRSKANSLEDLYQSLRASGSDYLLLAAAIAVPLYTSGVTILQPFAGVLFVTLSWIGMLTSYLVRLMGMSRKVTDNLGWILLGLAIIVATNLDTLNTRLPGGGFPWQMAPAAFMCWFIVISSYVLWNDNAMHFLLVPGIALFGVQSYIETAGFFVISLVLFMVSVAVLLTRLHIRTMIASARAAGVWDLGFLYSGPWKAVAGPVLAIVSVLAVAGSSYVLAPQIGGAVRKLAGEPEIRFDPPRFNRAGASGEGVARRIGNGPLTASNIPVLQVTSKDRFQYLRSASLGYYRGNGWTDVSANRRLLTPSSVPAESELDSVLAYELAPPTGQKPGQEVKAVIESISKQHDFGYMPGWPLRIEYGGQIVLSRGQFVQFPDLLPRGSKYYVRALLSSPSPEQLRAAPVRDRAQVAELYRGIGRDRVSAKCRQLAQDIASRNASDYDTVLAFIREIQSRTKYNLKAARIDGEVDRVEKFLFETREGYCDLFASSLTVLCRSAGIQARPVVGYLVNFTKGDTVTVRDRDAHMWTEVYFENYGWVPFDATDGATAVPGGEVGSLLEEEENLGDLTWAAWTGGTVFTLALIALLIGSYLSWRKTHPMLSQQHRRLWPLYARFLRAMRPTLKRPKAISETTREYAQAYAFATANGEAALFLAGMFDGALYAQESPQGHQVKEIETRLTEFESEVKANAKR